MGATLAPSLTRSSLHLSTHTRGERIPCVCFAHGCETKNLHVYLHGDTLDKSVESTQGGNGVSYI
ncbi:hypothetical protein PC116_g4544 [Phytophthora cactorum]|nr:hypothetical protein PC119_g5069 [Phytophthora cactorum]KAG4247692.1 hypothetical protein PC116_g4544 [Phytophthora cactorum]